jgi:hypothetical protein
MAPPIERSSNTSPASLKVLGGAAAEGAGEADALENALLFETAAEDPEAVGDPTVAAEVAEIVSLSFVFSKEYKERRS